MKYNVTNVSAQSDKSARAVFLTEAGKLLAPGDSISCNRIDRGTWGLRDGGLLKIEEGDFPQAPIFADKPVVPPEDETATPPRAENVAARKADALEMDKRIAAAKAVEDAKAAPGVVAVESSDDGSSKKPRGKV